MKILIFTLLLILNSYNKADSQSSQTLVIDGDVYIYDYAIKRLGRANLGFIIVGSNSYQDISFDIHYSKGNINKVNKTIGPVYSNNNIAEKLGSFYYDSNSFTKKCRLIPDNIYKMISSSFLEVTNTERLKILNELFSNYKCSSNDNNMNVFGQIHELQVRNFSEISKEILGQLDKMGIDDSPLLNRYESTYLNVVFETTRKDFDFTDKKVFFFGPGGLVYSDKQRYFNELTKHTFVQSGLHIFNEIEREESGGFDAVIVYWNKRNYLSKDLIKKLKKKP